MEIVNTTAHPDSQKLVPYTGFYRIGTSGAFLSIDTTIHRTLPPAAPVDVAVITLSYSPDGASTTTYTFDSSCSFSGGVLTVPGVMDLTFARAYNEGALVSFTGKINGTNVNGSTQFNPVELENFVGKYYDVIGGIPFEALLINSASDIQFSFGTDQLHPLTNYTYNPAMYVMTFDSIIPNAGSYTLMLGTAGELGLACSVQQDKKAGYLFSCFPKKKH